MKECIFRIGMFLVFRRYPKAAFTVTVTVTKWLQDTLKCYLWVKIASTKHIGKHTSQILEELNLTFSPKWLMCASVQLLLMRSNSNVYILMNAPGIKWQCFFCHVGGSLYFCWGVWYDNVDFPWLAYTRNTVEWWSM